MKSIVLKYEEGGIVAARTTNLSVKDATEKLRAYLDSQTDDRVEVEEDTGTSDFAGEALNVVLRSDDPNYDGAVVYAIGELTAENAVKAIDLFDDVLETFDDVELPPASF